ncbi:hypothetical protein CFP56_002756, partial [Quercus suber]
YNELYLNKTGALYLQNNSIHAIIRNNIAKKFKPLLQEGKLYELSYFQVVDGNALYRPVDNDIKIMFTLKTSIKEIKETDVDIPRHKFEFVDYNKIHQRVNKHVQLSGEYNLSSTSATRVYIDLDIPETAEFKDQYRIQLKVEDSSGMATFILFDSEAEKLLNISPKTF